MPIEIRELHIKAVIDTGGGKVNNEHAGPLKKDTGSAGESSEQLIDLCVEKVLEMIKEKEER